MWWRRKLIKRPFKKFLLFEIFLKYLLKTCLDFHQSDNWNSRSISYLEPTQLPNPQIDLHHPSYKNRTASYMSCWIKDSSDRSSHLGEPRSFLSIKRMEPLGCALTTVSLTSSPSRTVTLFQELMTCLTNFKELLVSRRLISVLDTIN